MMGDTRDGAPAPVRVERLDAIAHVVLDRPGAANALSFELLAALVDAIGRLVADGVRAMVLSGAGGRFSAGADLDELSGEAGDIEFDDAVAAVGQALAEASFPVVAAIENYAFGAGVDLAWSCDAVVVARDARLAVPATQLGLLYNPASLRSLHTRIGDRAWRRLVLLGDELDGETAFLLGMGESLAEPGQAVDEAVRLASAAMAGGEAAVAATKRFGRAIVAGTAADAEWESVRRSLLAGADRREALEERKRKRGGS
jgi:enoyl-CoA hydratase/carnithine racemase